MKKNKFIPFDYLLLSCKSSGLYLDISAIADPFMLTVNDNLYVFAEIEGTRKSGDYFKKIGVFLIAPDLTNFEYLGETWTEDDGEYSFPFLVEVDDRILMIPDFNPPGASSQKTFRVYSTEVENFPFGWKRDFEQHLEGAKNPSDKILIEHNGAWYLFVSDNQKGGKLLLYVSENLKDWEQHPQSPLLERPYYQRVFNKFLPYSLCKIRPWRLGGGPFRKSGKIVIPVQHQFHNKIYGEAVSLLEVDMLEKDQIEYSLSENPILTASDDDFWRRSGAHHICVAHHLGGTIVVTDGFDGSIWSSAIGRCSPDLLISPL